MSGRSGRPSTREGEGPRDSLALPLARGWFEVEPVITVEGTVLFRGG